VSTRTLRTLTALLLGAIAALVFLVSMEATGVGRRRAYELLAQVRAEGNGQGTP
jgi:hypothetical protein